MCKKEHSHNAISGYFWVMELQLIFILFFPLLVFHTTTCIESKNQYDTYALDSKEYPKIQKQKVKKNDNLVTSTTSSAFLSMSFRTNLLHGSGLICNSQSI